MALEYIKNAVMSIKNNKKRSFLTMLGIIIGISSVIMIIAIGNGMREEINTQLNDVGDGQIELSVNMEIENNEVIFTEEDCDLLKEKVAHIKGASMIFTVHGTAEGRKGEVAVNLRSGNECLQYFSKEPVIKGSYFTANDCLMANKVCVMDESSARTLFGTTDVVGMSFDLTIGLTTRELTIIGIRKDSDVSEILAELSGRVVQTEVPNSLLENEFGLNTGKAGQLVIATEKLEYAGEALAESKRLLENFHHVRGENKIKGENLADYKMGIDTVLTVVTAFISFVAVISLVVGGIGVMNIMMVSVTERTKEIGIRKSLGARTKSILIQFLAESGIITLAGGIIGVLLGNFLAIVICSLIGFPPQLSITTSLFAAAFSIAVGIFFGMYPAKRAAKLNPIDALRHE